MQMRAWGTSLILAAALLWVLGGTVRETALCPSKPQEHLGVLEANVAADSGNVGKVVRLGQAYLDAQQPGLAVTLLEAVPEASKKDVRIRHTLARALLDQGRNDRALYVENQVVTTCSASSDGKIVPGVVPVAGCDAVLLASAMRRVMILRELVALGVRDTQAHPEASLACYRNATREATIGIE